MLTARASADSHARILKKSLEYAFQGVIGQRLFWLVLPNLCFFTISGPILGLEVVVVFGRVWPYFALGLWKHFWSLLRGTRTFVRTQK